MKYEEFIEEVQGMPKRHQQRPAKEVHGRIDILPRRKRRGFLTSR